jgi:hypothetical protein
MRRESDDQIENIETFLRTFHNGDYDVEFDNALSLDRELPSPVRLSQASYNKPDNWIERNRIGLDKIKGQLQCLIDSLSHGASFKFQLQLRHNAIYDQLADNEEPIVWHEPILEEYWNHFEAEIDRMRQLGMVTDIIGIQITNVEMKKERLAALVDIIVSERVSNSSTEVNLVNANICGEGIICLSKLLDVSSNLQFFQLDHNRIDNMNSARCISRSLKSHTRINILKLAHCELGSNPEILLVILKSDVKCINLNNNNIDSLGAAKIAEYLEGNPHIDYMSFAHNRLNDNDVLLISQALKRNTNLRRIDLRSNNFTSIGVKALLTCVFDSSSLNAISESNHILNLMHLFYSNNDSLEDCIDKLLNLNRTQKIFLALQDKDSLLKYLANLPAELIPEVLEFTQWVDDQPLNKHLNIFYSIVRWWNMPMLYSHY